VRGEELTSWDGNGAEQEKAFLGKDQMMKSSRRRKALVRAMDSATRDRRIHRCESLEQRVFLEANDPVLVLVGQN
jgi:hypothetical protein